MPFRREGQTAQRVKMLRCGGGGDQSDSKRGIGRREAYSVGKIIEKEREKIYKKLIIS